MKQCIVTLTGPTCSGKSYLEERLAKRGFGKAVSTTSRAPRVGEVNGREYHFTSRETLQRLQSQGDMVELVEYDGEFYGLTAADAKVALADSGRMVVVCDPEGAKQIRRYGMAHGLPVISCWVACKHSEQVSRLLARNLPREALERRLVTMMTTEAAWRRSAEMGQIHYSQFRYDIELWHAGPENEAIYLDAIHAAAVRK